MMRQLFTAALATSLVTVGLAAHAKSTIRVGTLAPKHSPWGKVFTAWAKAADEKTKGELDVQWLWNGTAGPETNMVGKIRSGQLAGATITAVGLSAIYKPIVTLQMPGAFKTWAELDKARDVLRPEFDKAITEAGFYVTGWGDVGVGRIMSQGFDVKLPEDLRGKTPGITAQDVIGPKVFEAIGGVTPKPADVTEFLPLLNSGAINVLMVPALAAEQLQWASRLDHVNSGVAGFGVGAGVFSESELSKLPKDLRETFQQLGRSASAALAKSIRGEDDAAFERVKKKMTVHQQTDAERAEWEKIYKKACQRVKTAMPGDVLSKIGYC